MCSTIQRLILKVKLATSITAEFCLLYNNFTNSFYYSFCLIFVLEFYLFSLGQKMSSNRSISQSKEALLKSYQVRLKDDVKSMLENFEGKLQKSG